jgi:hypothetical protein
MTMSIRLIALIACLCVTPIPAYAVTPAAHETPGSCGAMQQPLAFWFGHWNVYADGKLDGRSFIESTLIAARLSNTGTTLPDSRA